MADLSIVMSLNVELGRDDAPLCGILDTKGINSLMSIDNGKMKENN